MKPIKVMMLSRDDVAGLNLTPEQIVETVEQALKEHADGTYEMHPKIGVHPTETGPANFIHAMPAYLRKLGACGLKWVGGFAGNHKVDLPNVTGIQVYNDTATGIPLAIMDCSYLTGLRTAAVSAIAVKYCRAPQTKVFALVGCGFEGAMHLRFLAAVIPEIETVRLRDIRDTAMAALKEQAASYFSGEIILCSDNESCLRDADVIITCTNGDTQIIEQEWFKPGCLGVGIEGGCAYTAAALHQADKFIVDDVPTAQYFDEIGRNRLTEDGKPDPEFPGGLPPIYSTIGEIVAAKKKGRESASERIVALPIGIAICDIAMAHLIYNTAAAKNVGSWFRLA